MSVAAAPHDPALLGQTPGVDFTRLFEEAAKGAPEFPENLRAVGGKIVVLPAGREERMGKAGLVIVPDNVQQRATRGFVLAVGPGEVTASGLRASLDVKEGCWVAFPQYSGTAVEVGEHELIVLKESDILFVY